MWPSHSIWKCRGQAQSPKHLSSFSLYLSANVLLFKVSHVAKPTINGEDILSLGAMARGRDAGQSEEWAPCCCLPWSFSKGSKLNSALIEGCLSVWVGLGLWELEMVDLGSRPIWSLTSCGTLGKA